MPAEEVKFINPLDAIDAAIDAAMDVEEGSATAGSAGSDTVGRSAHLPFDAAKRALHHAEESARGHYERFHAHHGHHAQAGNPNDLASITALRLGRMLCPRQGQLMERPEIERGIRMVASFASALERGGKRPAIFPRKSIITALGGEDSRTGESCRGSILRYLLPQALALADSQGGHLTMTKNFVLECEKAMRQGTRAVRDCREEVRLQNVEEKDRRKKEKAKLEKLRRENEQRRRQRREALQQASEALQHKRFRKKKAQAAYDALAEEEAQEARDAEGNQAALQNLDGTMSPRAVDHSQFHQKKDGASQVDELKMLVATLEDPYFIHIVLPQLETWLSVFCIFDLRRSGSVDFHQLQSGLISCCTPEIAILKDATTVQMLTDATEVVSRVDQIISHCRDLLENLPVVFDAKAEGEMDEAIRTVHGAIHESGVHVGGDVAALMKCLQSLHSDDRVENPKAFGVKGAEILAQIASFKRMVASILAEGREFEQRNLYCSHRRALINCLRRAMRRKILIRRVRLLAKLRIWDPDCMKELVIYSKLKRLQRRARDRIAKRRPGFLLEATPKVDVAGDAGFTLRIAYLAWPSVLIRFYSESNQEVREFSLRQAESLMETANGEQPSTRRRPFEVDTVDGSVSPVGGSPRTGYSSASGNPDAMEIFPSILLTGREMMVKIDSLQRLLSNWNALTNLMDQSSSGLGSLKVKDLRCALMAMAELGLIAEPPLASHPLDERFQPVRRPYSSRKLTGKIYDYEFVPGPRKALLLGTEPIDLSRLDSWALTIDFKCLEANVAIGHSYNVLVTSYRGGALVCRSAPNEEYGGQVSQVFLSWFFVPCEVFRNPEAILADIRRFVNGPKADLYEIIKPMSLPVGRWFTLTVQSEMLPGDPHAPTSRSIPKCRMRLGLRIDNSWDSSAGDLRASTEPLHFSYWSGSVDFDNVYSLGNSFDNQCSSPASTVDWAIGPVRRFAIFRIDRDWLNSDGVIQKKPIHHLGWTRLRLLTLPVRANSLTEEAKSITGDLRYFLWKALNGQESGIVRDKDNSIVVEGLYRIYGSVSLKGRRHIVTMRNEFAVEHEKGLPVHHVVHRRDPDLLQYKLEQLPALIRSVLGKAPIDGWKTDDNRFWAAIENNLRLSFTPTAVFAMKGKATLDEPGINSLGTATQMRVAISDMQRDVRASKLKAMLYFLLFSSPFSILFWLFTTENIRQRMHDAGEIGPVDAILLHIKKRVGVVPKIRTVLGLAILWGLFAWTTFVFLLHVARYCYLEEIHPMEAKLASGYYVWAALLLAIEVTTQVSALPSDAPFRLAYKRAEMAMAECTLINILDGQRFPCTGAGFLQMVTRLDESEGRRSIERTEDSMQDDVDEGEAGDGDVLSLGRSLLKALWKQKSIHEALPWKEENDQVLDPTLDFKITSQPKTSSAWQENNKVFVRGMLADFDMGSPTLSAEIGLVVMALLNSMLGTLHRITFANEHMAATKLREREAGVDGCAAFVGDRLLPSISTAHVYTSTLTIFVASWIVYRVIFCTAFRWFMILAINKQSSAALAMDSAMAHHLPCYLNLRDKGNLKAWHHVHEFLGLYGDKLVFGAKSQFTILSSMVGLCAVAFSSIQSLLGGEAEADMSDPETLYSLFNVIVMCSMVLLALVALERLNAESEKLLKRLDLESLELLSQIENRVQEYSLRAENALLEEEQLRQSLDPLLETRHRLEKEWAVFKQSLVTDGDGTSQLSREQLTAFDQVVQSMGCSMKIGDRSIALSRQHMTMTQGIVERHVLEDEYAYLQTIIAKLRDLTDAKEIFGVRIDKSMISRILTGIVGLLSILLKSTIDMLVASYLADLATVDAGENATDVCLPIAELRGREICDGL